MTSTRKVLNWIGMGLFVLLGVAATIPLFLIIIDIYSKGIDAINRLGGLWHFLTSEPPSPLSKSGGVGPPLIGTLYMTALGAIGGFALGFPLGVYIGEMRREKLANAARVGVNVLVEFPTITIGLFVYAVMGLVQDDLNRYILGPVSATLKAALGNSVFYNYVSWFVGPLDSFNAYAGAAALALVMIPYVALITASAYASVAQPLREAAYGIGGREFNALFIVMRKVVSRAVLTAALIGTAKIAGETAPLLFTAFGNNYYAPFTGSTGAVSLWIYAASETPYNVQIMSAYGAAAVLLTIILILFISARIKAIHD
jgi:phosphate transport system permease protein|nr:MAG: phosphate ABC transporter permease [Thermoproteus sp. AZ2]